MLQFIRSQKRKRQKDKKTKFCKKCGQMNKNVVPTSTATYGLGLMPRSLSNNVHKKLVLKQEPIEYEQQK